MDTQNTNQWKYFSVSEFFQITYDKTRQNTHSYICCFQYCDRIAAKAHLHLFNQQQRILIECICNDSKHVWCFLFHNVHYCFAVTMVCKRIQIGYNTQFNRHYRPIDVQHHF